ncbi:MAG: hypothetical protein ACRDJ1_13200 [Actinomycetota bacterium]
MRVVDAAGPVFGEDGLPKVSASVRWFVWAFLTVFVITGLAEIEAFPFTGWRLFSGLRHERSTSLAAFAVDEAGEETPFSFRELPPAYRWGTNVLRGFTRRSPADQAAICDEWAAAARAAGRDVRQIHIYEVVRVVSERDGDRGAPPSVRSLRIACGDGSVQTAAS